MSLRFGVGVLLDSDSSIFCLGGVPGGLVGEELGSLPLGASCLSPIGGDDLWWSCTTGEGDLVVRTEGAERSGPGDLSREADAAGSPSSLTGALRTLSFRFSRKRASEAFLAWGNSTAHHEANCNLLVQPRKA